MVMRHAEHAWRLTATFEPSPSQMHLWPSLSVLTPALQLYHSESRLLHPYILVLFADVPTLVISTVTLKEVPAAQPCYKWYEIPYYWAGLKAYDLVAGTQGLTLSRFTSASEAQRQFPTLAERRPNRDTLKGAVRYHTSPILPV